MTLLVKNIDYLLNKRGMNAYQLQDKSDIAQSTTFRILNGDTKSPSSNTVKKYADFFNVSESDLRFKDLSLNSSDMPNDYRVDISENKPARRIPVLNYVQAGMFCEYYDDAIANEFELTHGEYGDHVYWVVIEGLSMTPDFYPDDRVLIDPDIEPVAGDYIIAMTADKQMTFKKYRPKGFDDTGAEYIHLIPSNPDFPAIDSRYTNFQIMGVAIERKTKLK